MPSAMGATLWHLPARYVGEAKTRATQLATDTARGRQARAGAAKMVRQRQKLTESPELPLLCRSPMLPSYECAAFSRRENQ